ncbi:hypothetical protein GRX03_08920 [Halovenus sp. WSH3]|uniref:DolP-mannose mannosyltransferase n=1 Tax=Halovenus carboxidivorans TaxID=2692199 RepID=A0A6B0T7Y7_9EURY|nr:DolP-mannose mannosyltransferase [Halovenus carboxidivorans]MXR51723.1 hypothetical protein [Halovenus carboxidivorans]
MGVSAGQIPQSKTEFYEQIDTHWFWVLLVGSGLIITLATLVQFARSPFYIHIDSALFQHAGWSILNGEDLYVDIWDLKPPLIYFVTTILAALSFGNMAVLHVLSVIVAVGTVTAGVTLLGVLTHRLTGDGFASVVAGLAMFVLTSIYSFPYAGIRPKYFAFLCAVGALILAIDDRPFSAGAVGAMGAGFWQLGGPVAFLVVGIGLQRTGKEGLLRTVAGGVAAAVFTVAPFVLQGHTVPLFVEAVIAPVYGVEGYSLVGRLLKFVIEIGYGVLIVPIAVYGWSLGVAEDYRRYWWVAAGGAIYLLQMFLEFQGAIDLVITFVFLSLGAGLAVAHRSVPSERSLLAGVVLVLVVTSGGWHMTAELNGPNAPLQSAVENEYDQREVPAYDSLPADPEGWPSMETIYWEKLQPDQCHYRLGNKQKYFEQETGGTLYKSTCGQWPYDQPPLQWFGDLVTPWSGLPAAPVGHSM